MIPRGYKGDYLIGRKCRPVRNIRNGGGCVVTPKTVCTIKEVVRGLGFTIETEVCPCCGQQAYIRGVSRCDLELIEEPETGGVADG